MAKYLEFKVSLLGIDPDIWRRFLLAESATFMDLHDAIQDAFGWEDYHLFEFREVKGRQAIAGPPDYEPEFVDEEEIPKATEVKLKAVIARRGEKCLYVYDFGDNWEHAVEFMDLVELPERFKRRLTGGARACPPEDCGGVWGYEECVLVANKPEDEWKNLEGGDLLERKEWLGDWKPEEFDLKDAQRDFDE